MGYLSINGRSEHSNARELSANGHNQMKLLAQSRSEKNFTEMKFRNANLLHPQMVPD